MYEKQIVIISHPRFFTKLYYDSTTNIMGENLYERFGLPKGIIVHKNLAQRLYAIVPVLEHFNLKVMFTDVYRPVEMQQFLYDNWEQKTGQPPKISLANIDNAPHSKGIAFDCKLTDNDCNPILLPSSSIKFNPEERSPDYAFNESIPEEKTKMQHRNFMRTLMLCAGISPINKEWFHFQLPESESYEAITIAEAQNADLYPYEKQDTMFYDIFGEYQNDEFEGKTHFWINDERYYEQFKRIGLDVFIKKLEELYSV